MNAYKQFVKQYLAEFVKSLRLKRNLTQEKMAEQLHVTARAYGDLERGKFCFSATTFSLLLLMLNEDELKEFLDGLRENQPEPDSRRAV